MEFLRTPPERLAALPAFSYQPQYLRLGDLRIAYIDKGNGATPPVLMLHGEPTWSYLYRKMIPVFVAEGIRAVAPNPF